MVREGVDGSSPSEGLKTPANRPCLLSVVSAELQVRRGSTPEARSGALAGLLPSERRRIRRSSAAEAAPRSHVLLLTDAATLGRQRRPPSKESHGIGFVDLGREDRLGQVAER